MSRFDPEGFKDEPKPLTDREKAAASLALLVPPKIEDIKEAKFKSC